MSAFFNLNFLASYLGLNPSNGNTFSQKLGSSTVGTLLLEVDLLPSMLNYDFYKV